MGKKPKYRVKFVDGGGTHESCYTGLYYSGKHPWQGVEKRLAEKLTHKEAVKVICHLKRPGIRQPAILEPV